MRFLSGTTQNVMADGGDLLQCEQFEERVKIKWEDDQTPEALYAQIIDISTRFEKREYTKALAVQRLLDLLYDINQTGEGITGYQAKSRYYLLIFNYIDRIRSARRRFSDLLKLQQPPTDQVMYINGIDFSKISLPGLIVGNALFEECTFVGANLKGFSANSCQFIQCRFESANFTGSEFVGSSFEGIVFSGGNFSSSRFLKSSFIGCDFSEIISSRGQHPLRVNGCDFLACSFREADLRSANFRNTKMVGCDTLDAKKENSKGLL